MCNVLMVNFFDHPVSIVRGQLFSLINISYLRFALKAMKLSRDIPCVRFNNIYWNNYI